jgi:chaperonin GroEL
VVSEARRSGPCGRGSARRPGGSRFRGGVEAQQAIQRGFALAERTLGPTLGPTGVAVAIARIGRPGRPPELLDEGDTIARRITGIADDFSNTGLMLARHAAWRQGQAWGDGTATAVVLGAAAHRALLRQVVAGEGSLPVRLAFDDAVSAAVAHVQGLGRPVTPDQLPSFAARSLSDPVLERVVVEVMTRMGHDAAVVTRDAPDADVRAQYVDGAMWEAHTASTALHAGGGNELLLPEPHVLVWDADLDDTDGLIALLRRALEARASGLLLVAKSFSDPAIGLLAANRMVLRLGAVVAPMAGRHQRWALDDLAALTGTQVFGPGTGDRVGGIPLDRLGRARRALVGPRHLNIAAGQPRDQRVVAQVATTRHLLEEAGDLAEARELRERLGRLAGGMAIVWVGGRTDLERTGRRAAVDRALRRLAAVVRGGAVPGGGSSYLSASRALDTLAATREGRRAAFALGAALQRPTWWIGENAHVGGRRAVALAGDGAPERGLDVERGTVVDLRSCGLVDPTDVVIGALRAGAGVASTAISAGWVITGPHSPRAPRP